MKSIDIATNDDTSRNIDIETALAKKAGTLVKGMEDAMAIQQKMAELSGQKPQSKGFKAKLNQISRKFSDFFKRKSPPSDTIANEIESRKGIQQAEKRFDEIRNQNEKGFSART